MPRWLLFLLLALGSMGLAVLVQEPDEDRSLERQQRLLQSKITSAQEDLDALARSHLQEIRSKGGRRWMQENAFELEGLRQRTGIVTLGLEGDSLICWSGPPPAKPASMNDAGPVVKSNSGSVHLHSEVFQDDLHVHSVRPIWLAMPIENRYLRSGFHESLGMPTGLVLANVGDSGSGGSKEAHEMFRVTWRDGALESGRWLILRSIAIVLALILLLATFWSAADRLAKRSVSAAIWLFTFLIVSLRAVTLLLPLPSPLDRFELFDPAIYATSALFPSLGDLLVNAVLVLLIALFLFKHHGSLRSRLSVPWTIFIWCILFTFGAGITDIVIGAVKDSRVQLDLFHLPSLDILSVLVLASMTMFFASWVLAAVSLIGPAIRSDVRSVLLSCIGVAAAVIAVALVAGVDDLLPRSWPFPAGLLLIVALAQRVRAAHYIAGILLLSAISMLILMRYGHQREKEERQVLAERSISREDPVVELLFLDMAPRLRTDRQIYKMLATGRNCSTADLDEVVRQRFFSGYWERYDIRLFAFGTAGQVLCSTDPDPPRSFQTELSVFTDPRAAADMPDLLMEELPGQGNFYHSRVAIMPVDTLAPAQLVIELYPRTFSQGFGFPDLLIAGEDPIRDRLGRYSFARFERNGLAEHSGNFLYPLKLDDRFTKGWSESDGWEHYTISSASGTTLVLSLASPSVLDHITTFSYLFTFYGILLGLIVFITGLFRSRRATLGLSTKVRLALILFACISLIAFGIGAQRLLDRQYADRNVKSLLEKANSVHAELQQKLDGITQITEDRSPYLEHLLGRASNVFFTDITLYSTHGRVIASSRPQMFTSGLLSRRMDPVAFTELAINGKSSFIHEESIGSAVFRSAYMPLQDRRGNVLAYLSLPSFADQRQQEEERAGVVIAVVNLFVLLFALSVLVAFVISNWTLRPLELLKRGLSRVALRGNEPILYHGDDEVGQLVEVYNQKVLELQRSAEMLARSERESAWRDMARQVAHEIKNPLTPMKLGIQQFQRSWDPASPDAHQKLQRFSQAMVEQIDALNGVATAFSQFAQMPAARAEEVELNVVLRAAAAVFSEDPKVRIDLRQAETIWVHADREQLLRVFNNLLKNAIQAIPDDRDGSILIQLVKDGSSAVVEIKDNGSGIDEADRDRIFTPSFTTKTSGMGLGLAMVKRMVEGAGGQVWFSTEKGVGTSFFVSLPMIR
jgi:signal transduction histidine kinase